MKTVYTIVDVEATQRPAKDGKTMNDLLTITYKSPDRDGKLAVGSKTMFEWATPKDIYKRFADAVKGDEIPVELEKNDKGFWNITAVDVEGADKVSASPGKPAQGVQRSNFETTEERAARQKLIVKQSCLAQAVSYHASSTPETTISHEDVLKTADVFVAWVHNE